MGTNCTSATPNPEGPGQLACSGDAGHRPDHYVEGERGEIVWAWPDSGPARRVTRR